MPDRHLYNLPWPLVIVSFVKGKWDGVTHKELLAIAIGIIGGLCYWGFSDTLTRLQRIETNQLIIKNEVTQEFAKLHEVDYQTNLCIGRIEERQNGALKKLEELEKRH